MSNKTRAGDTMHPGEPLGHSFPDQPDLGLRSLHLKTTTARALVAPSEKPRSITAGTAVQPVDAN